jgi:DnaK suppressor protein
LNAGEYGWCLGCGVGIAPARLHSVPWTPYCLRCQEAHEHEEQTGGDRDVPG